MMLKLNRFLRTCGSISNCARVVNSSRCYSRNIIRYKTYNSGRDYSSWIPFNFTWAPLGAAVGLVLCDAYINNEKYDSKRFFRAAKYGSENDIKRYVTFN